MFKKSNSGENPVRSGSESVLEVTHNCQSGVFFKLFLKSKEFVMNKINKSFFGLFNFSVFVAKNFFNSK